METIGEVAAKERASNELANGAGSAIGYPNAASGGAINRDYETMYAKEREAERQEQSSQRRTDWKLNIFAEIMRARAALTPEEAADDAAKVYAKLCA